MAFVDVKLDFTLCITTKYHKWYKDNYSGCSIYYMHLSKFTIDNSIYCKLTKAWENYKICMSVDML